MNIEHIPDLSREIKRIINEHGSETFPVSINFREAMECPQFKITVEKLDADEYIDCTGQRWKKIK